MDKSKTKEVDFLAVKELEKYLWPEGMPKWMYRYSKSPELMVIFFLMFVEDSSGKYDRVDNLEHPYRGMDLRLHKLLSVDTRECICYKVTRDFTMNVGTLKPTIDLPKYLTEAKLRECNVGDTLVMRLDSSDKTAELQILKNGLFGRDLDLAIFDLDNSRFSIYAGFVEREQKQNEGFRP